MANRPATQGDRDERRRRAAEAVWQWKSPPPAPAARPASRFAGTVLRDFSIGIAIAAVLYAAGRPVVAGVAGVISVVVLMVRAALPPPLSAPVMASASRLAHRAGRALTAIVLGGVYFTVFLLLRAWRTLTGHDSLRLKPRRPGQSFWVDRSTLPETSPDKPY